MKRRMKRLHSADARLLRDLLMHILERVLNVEEQLGHVQAKVNPERNPACVDVDDVDEVVP